MDDTRIDYITYEVEDNADGSEQEILYEYEFLNSNDEAETKTLTNSWVPPNANEEQCDDDALADKSANTFENYCMTPNATEELCDVDTLPYTKSANIFANSWMTANSIEELSKVLQTWNFQCLLPVFCDECIDLNALKIMTPLQLMEIGKKWKLKWGIQIKFEKVLMSWQNSLTPFNNSEQEPNNNVKADKLQIKPSISKSVNAHSQTAPNVKEILKSSSQGTSILNFYESNLKLNNGSRAIVVDLIINYMIQNDIRMNVVLAKRTAEGIVNVFKTEFLGYYYTKQPGKKPKGRIYDKYFNAIRKLKKHGILTKRPYLKKITASPKKRTFHLDPPEVNVDDSVEAILLDNCSWGEIENHWAATKNYRLAEVTNAQSTTLILEKWKQYKKPKGYKLVDMDFKHLYPNAGSLVVNFEAFASKIISIFEDRIKDPESKLIFQKMTEMSTITENGRCCSIFFLIHSILAPTAKVVKVDNGKRICKRFSIKDSQMSFLICGATVAECEVELHRKYLAKKPIQPLILVSGSILEPKDIIVYFDGEKYRIHSVVGAVDICFKIFFVFNLKYPLESSLVWTFIEKHFYKMSINSDYDNPQIDTLISNLN